MLTTQNTIAIIIPQAEQLVCTKCQQAKPKTTQYFWQHKRSKTGFSWWCIDCSRAYAKEKGPRSNKKWYTRNSEQKRAYAHTWRKALRLQILQHYSGQEIPLCACCGDTHLEFLALDHINGGGTKHRKSYKSNSSIHVYSQLRKTGFPPGFRVLCHNCNQALGAYGYCPHQRQSQDE